MEKELNMFKINDSIGGNQDWFDSTIMKMGGCAICTALDLSIYLQLNHNIHNLYPYDINNLNITDYIKFSKIMKPYLKPRLLGINKLDIYINGYSNYLKDCHTSNIKLSGLSQDNSEKTAKEAIINQIDNDIPIPFLLLRHKNYKFKDFIWHWFLIIGYTQIDNEFYIKVSTYSNVFIFSLTEIWNTGFNQKGGLILINKTL